LEKVFPTNLLTRATYDAFSNNNLSVFYKTKHNDNQQQHKN